jgi:4-amino-4-deoxy-L-arabinose transferase-like glycosyltransferase
MGNRSAARDETRRGAGLRVNLTVLVAAAIFLGCIASPPGLMDDVDAVQAQIARNMLDSGDWVTARLNGVAYLEKAPLPYWIMAASYAVFGVHDWAARLPFALGTLLLCWVTARFGTWAYGAEAGGYSGLCLSASVGLWLFTRILIPDALLTLAIAFGLWGFLRALEEEEPHPRLWALAFWASMGAGVLLKGVIAVLFPAAAAGLYLAFTRQLFLARTWRRAFFLPGLALLLLIAAPWHVLATMRNPPYFDFTMHSEAGAYRGFFWFYFFNEHLLRFLNLRYPRDYNTVPRALFWLFHLLWFFPWSAWFPAIAKLGFRGADRASRTRLLALCWIGFPMVFFTFSTTQEYYSLPCYPAIALLLGPAFANGGKWIGAGTRAAAGISLLAAAAAAAILVRVSGVPTPGDISSALTRHPDLYTLSLGHMGDLTFESFAYLRAPLALAAAAFLTGAAGGFLWKGRRAFLAFALMMTMFFHAARLALVKFDPYLGSRALAEALLKSPEGALIVDDQYYTFSSIFFYANRTALLLNGRKMNLEYGSNAPAAPRVFLEDKDLAALWSSDARYYLAAEGPQAPRLEKLVGKQRLRVAAASGGKFLFTNR